MNFLDKIPSFTSIKKHSLAFLNISQSFGVINDNLFKFSMAFLLIDTLGKQNATTILAATGAIYVIPFLLFSASAGILADRFSKQKLLAAIKIFEVILMTLAVIAFATKSVTWCYLILFFLSIHSALFSPSKYGIISELVPKEKVSKANGLITSFTYLSIILGTFLASFLTEVTNYNYVFVASFCLLVALIGLAASLFVYPTKPQNPSATFNWLFVREIFRTLNFSTSTTHLLPSILGSSYFLMIGAFTQLNIIPFAIQQLKLNEVAGGYLFLTCALGIALGAFAAGKISKKRIELGLSCIAGIGITIFFTTLALFSSSLFVVVISLLAMGFFGGCFIVPFDTFTQLASRNDKRGQTIAAANFLSFVGVLLASFFLYLFGDVYKFSPATGFGIMGATTFIVTIFFSLLLSDLAIPYFSRHFLRNFTPPTPDTITSLHNPFLILENATWKDALKVAASFPAIHFLIPKESKLWHPLFHAAYAIDQIGDSQKLLDNALAKKRKESTPCLLLDGTLDKSLKPKTENPLLAFFQKKTTTLHQVTITPKKDTTTLSFKPID